MSEMVTLRVGGAPPLVRVARPTPSDASPTPGPLEIAVNRNPVGFMAAVAENTRIRRRTIPLRPSVIGTPVLCSCESTLATDAVGAGCFMTAQAPATCGVAIEVPLKTAKPPPGTDELIEDPGAHRSSSVPEFENEDTVSVFVVEPTVIAVEMQPGVETPVEAPSLPAAIAVAMPADRRLSIAAFRLSASQAVFVGVPPPRLMFTEAIESVVRRSKTRFRPASWSEVKDSAQGSSPELAQLAPVNLEKTLIEISRPSRATPENDVPLPAAMPATCVPCLHADA